MPADLHICWTIKAKIFPSSLIHSNERENRKLGALAKTARLKATVRELLGFLRRKAPLAACRRLAERRERGKRSLPPHVFHTRNRFMGVATKFQGAPLPREGPRRVEFPALIRHYAIFKSVPWNFFSLTRFCPAPSSSFSSSQVRPLSSYLPRHMSLELAPL